MDEPKDNWLIINKGTLPMEVYEVDSLEEAGRICGVPSHEIHWSVKRCGRWDREDNILIVIPATEQEI